MTRVGPRALLLAVLIAPLAYAVEETEARLSLDVREAPIQSMVRLLVELGDRQVVFDRGVDCALTLKLHEVRWEQTLETTLKACGLGYEETGGVLWVATLPRLREEVEGRRRVKAARASDAGGGLAAYRLSYARAEEMAPLLQRILGPAGEVTADPRRNVVIIRY